MTRPPRRRLPVAVHRAVACVVLSVLIGVTVYADTLSRPLAWTALVLAFAAAWWYTGA